MKHIKEYGLLLEYLNSEEIILYNYLNKTEKERNLDLAFKIPYLLRDFF